MVLVEIGGTVGDIESLPFIEAIRQMRRNSAARILILHVTLVPLIAAAQEFKPSPHSTR